MKFRFVIFSLLSFFCAQPILGQLSEEEKLSLWIQLYFAQQIRDKNEPARYSQEERVERRAKLLQQSEEIRTQMYSPKQKRLVKCAAYGSMGVMLFGMLAAVLFFHSLNHKDITLQQLSSVTKEYIIDEKLLTDLNAQWWYALKMCLGSFAGGIAASIPGAYFGKKLDLQNELTKKLQDIKKQIAELDALDAAEDRNTVIA